MRFSILLLSNVAALASAGILNRGPPSLPPAGFTTFSPMTLSDIKAGKDLPQGRNHSSPAADLGQFASVATDVQTASAASCAANPGMRFEWRQYSGTDRIAFIAAIKCLLNKPPSGNFQPARNRYEDFVRLHQLYMPNVHGNPKFLIWHRYYLWAFEDVLRKECGFDRAMVWWDETLDAGHFYQNDMFSSSQFFGTIPPPNNGQPSCITTGAFAGLTLNIGPGNNNGPHCLNRMGNADYTSQCNQDFINQCNSRGSYADMESCLEFGPHAYGHNGIGGTMSDVSASPSDPIFWMHHSFVDHSFRIWQNMDVNGRTNSINGNDANGQPLTMNTVISLGGIRPDVTIGQIMNTLSGTVIAGVPFCYRYNY